MKHGYRIKSSDDASERCNALPRYTTDREDAKLTESILIYVAELLEKLLAKGEPRKTRKPSRWQKHLSKSLKAGKTIQQASEAYKK